ncbi:MAG: gliding motility protein GldN [Dysgonamonadaceae bacterium]|nr:gliding motility protein GldN [Dysgonamonadaceae bacterium]
MKPIYFFSLLFVAYALAGFAQDPSDVRSQQIQSQIEEQRRRQAERNQYRQSPSAEFDEPQQQNRERDPLSVRRNRRQQPKTTVDTMPGLTERARLKNTDNSKAPVQPVWLREMYRIIDLDKNNNGALKYPVHPMGKRINLFTLLFRLLSENKIDAYAYSDNSEVFTEAGKISFEDILKSNQIPYTTERWNGNTRYVVDEIDMPSEDVSQYLIKDGRFFDQATGSYGNRITAICPIIVRLDYSDNTTHKSPVCWLLYEDIRPYLAREMIMASDNNNALLYTMDDFFTKNMYSGDIIKTVNLRNQSLQEQIGSSDPVALKHAQDSIEQQLKLFRKQLWVQADTTTVATDKQEKPTDDKQEKTAADKKSRGSKKSKEVKTPKAPKAKAEKSPSAPARSVRRSR